MKNYNTNKSKFLLTIAGPTAVGKTEQVIKLAQSLDCTIFSADSRQFYKEMNIGTAKPTAEERSQAEFQFVDCKSVQDGYTAGTYERDIREKLAAYFQNKDVAILSGGTGLYIKAALDGLDDFPEVEKDIVLEYEKVLEERGISVLQEELQIVDPQYAMTVDLQNSRRVIRALSVHKASEKPYSFFLNQTKTKALPYNNLKICLTRDREELYERINARVDKMMEIGLLEEVKSLQKYKHLRTLDTVGYSEIFQHLDGKISLERAVELIKRNTRRYAKRQMTWFNNQGEWKMMEANDYDMLYEYIRNAITS